MTRVVKLGRFDIAIEVSALSSFLAIPREGYILVALRIMPYLNVKNESHLVLDPNYANINYIKFKSDED